MKKIVFGILTTVVMISCSSKSDNPMNGNEDSYYANNIQVILDQSCATSGCHDSQTKQNGVNLTSYEAVMSSSGTAYGKPIVDPGNPENSPIVDVLTTDRDINISRMPYTPRDPLSEEQISTIRQWVADGATQD